MQVRDLVLGRIGGLVGSGDTEAEVEDRKIICEYLLRSLTDYLDRKCVAPELNMPFDKMEIEDAELKGESASDNTASTDTVSNAGGRVIQGSMQGNGNFVIRRNDDESVEGASQIVAPHQETVNASTSLTSSELNKTRSESAMDWRRRQNMTQSLQLPSSDGMLQRLSEREHAPGVRSPGCPCCDPDNLMNIVDGMLL